MSNLFKLNKHLDTWTEMGMAFTNLETVKISPTVFVARLRGIDFEIDRVRLYHIDNLIITFGREKWLLWFAEMGDVVHVGAKSDF